MRAIIFLLCLILGIPCLAASAGDWLAYGGNAGDKFSRLDQIMDLSGEPPSIRAARAVLAVIERKAGLPSPAASC